ncbi:CPBP family glutamic-type intramembrane protease [Blastococcus sp. SYSU D01042]
MTAPAPEEQGYTGPPPTLRPSPEQHVPVARVEAADEVEPPAPAPRVPYLLAMRDVPWAWWRPAAGLLLVAFLLGIALVLTRVVEVLTGTGADLDPVPLTWRGLLVTDVGVAVALPAVLLAWPIAHGIGPGRGLSVDGRLRWPRLRRSTLLALATAGAAVGLGVLGAVALADREVAGPVPEVGWVLLAGLLTVPLRAAAEEVLLRGYLSQAVAAWIGRPRAGAVVAALVSALLGALVHGTDDWPAFLGRVLLGLAASAAVALTGGVEAAVALHVVVAVVVLVLAAVLGEGAVPGLVPGGPGQAFALVGAAGVLAFAALAARRGART